MGAGRLFSYSTDVSRRRAVLDEEDAQELLCGLLELMSAAASRRAFAVLTEVSLYDHLVGSGLVTSRSLRAAKRSNAGLSALLSCLSRDGETGLGGDREPRAGALRVA